jgi:hypothetical protein
VDAELFSSIIKTFISVTGIEWTPGVVCVFDGLQSVLERVANWYEQRLESVKAGEAPREQNHPHVLERAKVEGSSPAPSIVLPNTQPVVLLEGVKLVEAEPIVDRKSAFVGRACRISDPAQVSTSLGAIYYY